MKHVVITIGREYGSGGRLIAKKLSEELGITFYDKELIAAVAKKTGFSENFIRDTEHQRPTNSFLYDLYTAVQTPSVPDQVFVAQAKVIKEAAAKESCVIVGRCADYILRDDPCLLSVFVHAPLDERIFRAKEEYKVEDADVRAYVLKQDKRRAAFYEHFSDRVWGKAENYHLAINSTIGLDTTVDLILALAEERGLHK